MTEEIQTYEGWLATLDEDELTGLLRRRPDVATDPPPRSFGLLAQLLVGGCGRGTDVGHRRLAILATLQGDFRAQHERIWIARQRLP